MKYTVAWLGVAELWSFIGGLVIVDEERKLEGLTCQRADNKLPRVLHTLLSAAGKATRGRYFLGLRIQ